MNGPIVKVIDLVPGKVSDLPTREASSLDEDSFAAEFVSKHKPVLIRGAAGGWPAIEKWRASGYLESRCGDDAIKVSRTFNPLPAKLYYRSAIKKKKLRDVIVEMREASPETTYSIPASRVPDRWAEDLGHYSFLGRKLDQPPRHHPRRRLFIYRNASTDWHYHPTDETLTTQIIGSKRVSTFRLTAGNWRSVAEPLEYNFHHIGSGKEFFRENVALEKFEGTLEPGDALYLPPFWWHGVDTADTGFGITLAYCFRTPLRRIGDWREPATRAMLGRILKERIFMLPPAIGLIAMSSLSRSFGRENWYR